jgi:hypothetical protein
LSTVILAAAPGLLSLLSLEIEAVGSLSPMRD